MSDFKRAFQRLRKQDRQPKVQDDNESEYVPKPPKRQRRGVSVFQRQLYKRRIWVEEYEAGNARLIICCNHQNNIHFIQAKIRNAETNAK